MVLRRSKPTPTNLKAHNTICCHTHSSKKKLEAVTVAAQEITNCTTRKVNQASVLRSSSPPPPPRRKSDTTFVCDVRLIARIQHQSLTRLRHTPALERFSDSQFTGRQQYSSTNSRTAIETKLQVDITIACFNMVDEIDRLPQVPPPGTSPRTSNSWSRCDQAVARVAPIASSTCQVCSKCIAKDEWQLGLMFIHVEGFMLMEWHHLQCFKSLQGSGLSNVFETVQSEMTPAQKKAFQLACHKAMEP